MTQTVQSTRGSYVHQSSHLIVTSERHPVGVVSSLDVGGALAWGRA
jgi:hypothetical protein